MGVGRAADELATACPGPNGRRSAERRPRPGRRERAQAARYSCRKTGDAAGLTPGEPRLRYPEAVSGPTARGYQCEELTAGAGADPGAGY